MTKTPSWLPDGSRIDPNSIDGDTVVETINGFCRARHRHILDPIVRVYADVTPPKPDPRVDVVARALHKEFCPVGDHDLALHEHEEQESWRKMAREILAALDAMGADQ